MTIPENTVELDFDLSKRMLARGLASLHGSFKEYSSIPEQIEIAADPSQRLGYKVTLPKAGIRQHLAPGEIYYVLYAAEIELNKAIKVGKVGGEIEAHLPNMGPRDKQDEFKGFIIKLPEGVDHMRFRKELETFLSGPVPHP